MNKQLIKERFSKCLKTYDENAKIQKIMAQKLISMSDRKDYKKILEIGCGTGLLTKLLLKNYTFEEYYANDIVSGCKDYIETLSPKVKFIDDDIEKFIKNDNNKYDLIVSNATFQWIDNLNDFINNIYNKINKNGILLFSIFGKDNFAEISEITGQKLKYISINDIIGSFNDKNFNFHEDTFKLFFKTPKDVLRHIKYTGVNALSVTSWTKNDMLQFENKYKDLCNGAISLTYKPIYIKITKN